MKMDQISEAVRSTCGEAGWVALYATIRREHTDEEIEELAQQLKLHEVDPRLHTDLAAAECIARFIHRLGEATGRPRVTALGLLAQADVARQGGHVLDAMGLFSAAGDAFLQADDRVGWARTRGGWLLAATWAGEITADDLAGMEAVREVLRDAAVHDSALLYRLAMVEQNIGLAWQNLEQYDQAIAIFDRALATLNPGTQRAEYRRAEADLRGMLLANKATTLLWKGDRAQAAELFRQARILFLDTGNAGFVALEEMNLAEIERRRWHLREALRLARFAVDGLREAHLDTHAGLALLYRADVLLALNRAEDALADATEAVALLRPLQTPVDLANGLSMLARARARCGEGEGALDALREAERLMAQAESLHAEYPVSIERAALLLTLGRAAEARDLALSLLRASSTQETAEHGHAALLIAARATLVLQDLPLAQSMAQALIQQGEQSEAPALIYQGHALLARTLRRSGDLDAALAHYDSAIETLYPLLGKLVIDQRSRFLEDKDAVYLEALSVALATGDALRALRYLEQVRARAEWVLAPLHDSDAPGMHATEWAARREALEDLRRRHSAISTEMMAASAPSLAEAKQQLKHLERKQELKRLERKFLDLLADHARQEGGLASVDGEAILRAAPQGATVLAYALVEDDLVIFVLREEAITAVRVGGGERQLRTLDRLLQLAIDALIQRASTIAPASLGTTFSRADGPLRKALQSLWSLLIAPVEHLLPADGGTLILVPHGLLHALPLLALHDGDRYLVERWVVQCVPSCQALVRRAEVGLAANRPPLALGYSEGGKLPNAVEEARLIARLLEGEAWVEAEATGERLLHEGRGRRYLHISAHGALRLDVPYSSFVQLADGPFHPSDVLTLDLRGCRLVTLSACRTGLGRQSGGDEQIGLVQAFCTAGAEAVLATLWRVDDTSTRAFMEHFYGQLASSASPAEALRSAQLAFISSSFAELPLAHPFFWAGFQLTTRVVCDEHTAGVATHRAKHEGEQAFR